ncbi:MAG: heterodisulfide reductase-related iron-sulfur binding cluster [Desulfovermiculus sp.]|nr:heterodisulfide reductase-related iron-sulfur binding cluster [Desulfovermiculus sp.]
MSAVRREIFWNIGSVGEVVLYLLAVAALGVFASGLWVALRRILGGQKVSYSMAQIRSRLMETIWSIASNRTVFRGHFLAGSMHLGIMWGMLILFVGTLIIAVEYDLFQKILGWDYGLLAGPFFLGFELVLDIFGALVALGVLMGLFRRYGLKRPQLQHKAGDLIVPLWLLLIIVTGFLVEGGRLAATNHTIAYSPLWSPLGYASSALWSQASAETVRAWHLGLWWVHGLLALGGIAAIPFHPKLMHLLTSPVNFLFQDLRSQGRLNRLDVEGAFERDENLGVERIGDLSRKELLDLTSCTECGRCTLNCPANIAGKSLSPREIVNKLRDQNIEELPLWAKAKEREPIIEAGRISAEEIDACTTCMACVEACPVYIDPLHKILELRRNQVMIQDSYPEPFAEVFAGVEKRSNPWNEHPTARMDWAKGLEVQTMADVAEAGDKVEYLLWVGCAAAFDPRNQKIARSLVRILQTVGISFAVLGEEEQCTGDPVRRMGHEYLFQMQAENNVETFASYAHAFDSILTLCPHCYNTLSKEYPDFGAKYPVIHHSEFLQELLENGRITCSQDMQVVVTYHDSCYLGRHNRIFDAPRRILDWIPGLKMVEMEQNRELGMCCGAGGGLTWIEEDREHRVNDRRVAQAEKAVSSVPSGTVSLVATACPFCLTMLEDGLAAKESEMMDKDIAEIVAQAMGLPV